MKCPNCGVELGCPLPSASAVRGGAVALPLAMTEGVEPRRAAVLDNGNVACPVCKFSVCLDYWLAWNSGDDSVYQNIPFQVKTHWLKILPKYFYAVLTGHKTFEIRKNDRGFKVGHLIILQRYDPAAPPEAQPRSFIVEIVYITDFPDGLRPGYVVLGIRRL